MVPLSCACCDQCIFAASYLFTELGSKWLIFISVGLPFLSVIVLMKIYLGTRIVEAARKTHKEPTTFLDIGSASFGLSGIRVFMVIYRIKR